MIMNDEGNCKELLEEKSIKRKDMICMETWYGNDIMKLK